MIGRYVVVRAARAGVHTGILAEQNGQQVKLLSSRRIYYWEGAFTLSELSQYGVSSSSKIAIQLPEIQLQEVIEIIPTTKAAEDNIREQRPYVPR